MKKWALFLIFSISCIVSALVSKTFTGAESDNWYNPNNWDPPGVPGESDDVHISEGTNCNLDIGIDVHCASLDVDGELDINDETHLSVAGSTSVGSSGNLSIEHGKFSSANLTNNGIVYSYHSELNVNGTFNNYGSLTLQDFSKFQTNFLINYNFLNISALGVDFNIIYEFINHGNVEWNAKTSFLSMH